MILSKLSTIFEAGTLRILKKKPLARTFNSSNKPLFNTFKRIHPHLNVLFYSTNHSSIKNQEEINTILDGAYEALSKNKSGKSIEIIQNILDSLQGEENIENLSNAYAILSSAYVRIKEYEMALEICDKRIRLVQSDLNPYIAKYSILKKIEDFSSALECLNIAAEACPQSAEPISMMAYHFYFNTSEYEKAFDMAEKAYKKDENHLSTIILLAMMYRKMGEKKESEFFFYTSQRNR